MNRFMGNTKQGRNPFIIIVGNQEFQDLTFALRQLFAQSLRRQLIDAARALDDRGKQSEW